MVFTTGQMLGIGVFTAAVLVIGMLLLKLESKIGTNYDMAEGEQSIASEAPSDGPTSATKGATARGRRSKR